MDIPTICPLFKEIILAPREHLSERKVQPTKPENQNRLEF